LNACPAATWAMATLRQRDSF